MREVNAVRQCTAARVDTTARTLPRIKIARQKRRERTALNLRRSLERAGVPMLEASRRIGTQQKVVQECCRLQGPTTSVQVADLEALGIEVVEPFMRAELAPMGLAVFRIPTGTDQRQQLELLAKAVKETGEAVAEFAQAVADGHVTPGEADRVAKEALEGASTLMAIWAFTQGVKNGG